jgi:pyruvate,water dikinase
VAENRELRDLFLTGSPEEALFRLRNEPAYAAVRDAFDAYLADYGVRSVGELKLESIPFRDNPLFCVTMVQNYLRTSIPDEEEQRARDEAKRTAADLLLKEGIRSSHPYSAFFRLPLYRWVLRKTRDAVRNRENQRFARAQAYDLVRRMVRALGKYWADREILVDPRDIFYLEMEELWSFIEGTSTCTNLKRLAALRKEEFENYRTAIPPDHIETYGEIYQDNTFEQEAEAAEGSEVLVGLGCSRGLVQGPVRVVEGLDAPAGLNGEILVARQTDPGWIVFFPSISWLIVEKGSLLSHSAIVAREMGLPTVVAVKNATKILKTGEIVSLDGSTGEVRIVKRSAGQT